MVPLNRLFEGVVTFDLFNPLIEGSRKSGKRSLLFPHGSSIQFSIFILRYVVVSTFHDPLRVKNTSVETIYAKYLIVSFERDKIALIVETLFPSLIFLDERKNVIFCGFFFFKWTTWRSSLNYMFEPVWKQKHSNWTHK